MLPNTSQTVDWDPSQHLPNTSQTIYWDPNQYQLESERRKRLWEEQARTSSQSFTGNHHQHAQTPPPLLTGVSNFETENSDERPQKRLKEDATSTTRIAEQAVAPAWQEMYACDTNDASHLQISPSLTSTFRNEVSGWARNI